MLRYNNSANAVVPLALLMKISLFFLSGLLALGAAPVFALLLRGRPALRYGIDGFVFVLIAGLLGFAIIPQAVHSAGAPAFGLFLLGLLLPWGIERGMGGPLKQIHTGILVLGGLGLFLHGVTDGISLALPSLSGANMVTDAAPGLAQTSEFLAISVIMHRLAEGFAIWWLCLRLFRLKGAAMAIAALMVATVFGYSLVLSERLPWLASENVILFQAFVIGTLFHLLVHPVGAPAGGKEKAGLIKRGGTGIALRMERWGNFFGLLALSAFIMGDQAIHAHDAGSRVQFALHLMVHPAPVIAICLLLFFGVYLFLTGKTGNGNALSLRAVLFFQIRPLLESVMPWVFAALLGTGVILWLLGAEAAHSAQRDFSMIEFSAFVFLVTLILFSFFMQGGRRFLARLVPPTRLFGK